MQAPIIGVNIIFGGLNRKNVVIIFYLSFRYLYCLGCHSVYVTLDHKTSLK